MNAKSRELRVKRLEPIPIGSKERVEAPGSSLLALDSRPSALGFSRGVTLIELLISIAIIATLAVMFLGASRYAMESARAARTKTTIAKLHTLIMEQYASYETRRVDIIEPTPNPNSPTEIEMKQLRLMAQRSIMQMEMPDRWSDILGEQVVDRLPKPMAIRVSTRLLPHPTLVGYKFITPAVSQIYTRRYDNLIPESDKLLKNQGAECLYLTVMYLTGDGEARTLFNKQDIGDTDGDGAPEFLDGWGQPISFIRWPAGLVSPLQPLSDVDQVSTTPPVRDPINDHDPYDPFRVDIDAFRLVPFIYSPGPDSELGILTDRDAVIGPFPYWESSFGLIGSPIVEDGVVTTDHLDNITNHLQEGR